MVVTSVLQCLAQLLTKMTAVVSSANYKSIQEKERVCKEAVGNQFPYQKQIDLKYPKTRNEQESPDTTKGAQ